MAQWIALLRGINVGGNNILPMKELRSLLTGMGCDKVKTYIQSGNCVFEADADAEELAERIGSGIEEAKGFRPRLFVLSAAGLEAAVDANPYQVDDDNLKQVHLYFLSQPAVNADLDALAALKKDNEAFSLTDNVFYLHAPDGIGRSKLAEKVERLLHTPVTARNLRTARKLLEMTTV